MDIVALDNLKKFANLVVAITMMNNNYFDNLNIGLSLVNMLNMMSNKMDMTMDKLVNKVMNMMAEKMMVDKN